VAGQHVPQLVPDDEPDLLVVHQVDHAAGDDDERLVGAQRHRVDRRVLADEQLRDLGQVQDVAAVQHRVVQVRELLLRRPDGAGQEHQPQRPVVEQSGQVLEDRVETGQLAQRHQR
jgi:hypothetical protein